MSFNIVRCIRKKNQRLILREQTYTSYRSVSEREIRREKKRDIDSNLNKLEIFFNVRCKIVSLKELRKLLASIFLVDIKRMLLLAFLCLSD